MTIFVHEEKFEIVHCCECGMAFAMTQDFYERRYFDGKAFCCPAGHAQSFILTKETMLKKDVEYWQQHAQKLADEANHYRRSAIAQKAVKTRLIKRIKNGVCPCCKRQFVDLTRHMSTKHPEYGE